MEDKQVFLAKASLKGSCSEPCTCDLVPEEEEEDALAFTPPILSVEEQIALNYTSAKFDCKVEPTIFNVHNAAYNFTYRSNQMVLCRVCVHRHHEEKPSVQFWLNGNLSLKEEDHDETMADLELVWNFIRTVAGKKELTK